MTAPQSPETFQYVYGIVRAGTGVPEDLTGVDGEPVETLAHGRCAAVVSDLKQKRTLGDRADLLAHQRVLDAFVTADVEVLPFRFGAVLAGRQAVETELLAENGEHLSQALDQLKGHHELRVKGTYQQDTVLREIMTEEPELAELNERLRNVPADAADAAHFDRIRLGELVAESMKHRRDSDGTTLLETLSDVAASVVPHTPVREEDVIDASFLVEHGRLPEFRQTVEKLSQDHRDRINLRLIGPLPPYDFVPEE